MDLILTGRGVQGEEALRMGLVNRLVPRGQAFDAAVRLAHELAAFPQRCLRSDRLSAYEQWSLSYEDALRNELRRGVEFVRVRCDGCSLERLVPFSCKGRGFCPSCGGRRMTAHAAQLVEAVLPRVSVRQWVLTLPYRLRYRLAWDHGLDLRGGARPHLGGAAADVIARDA